MSNERRPQSARPLAEHGLCNFPSAPRILVYACFGKGRERNRGDWKNENGRIHHRAGGSAGGAFRHPRLRDGYGGGSDARRARARVQPRRDLAARAADCDIYAIHAGYAQARADCHIRVVRRANANFRARANRANIRARYAHARADCDIRAKYARANCHNRAYRCADIRA